MAKYLIDDEEYDIDREVERAVIRRFLERRYITALALGGFIIGFLLGVIASVK